MSSRWRDEIKFVDVRFKTRQVVGIREGSGGQGLPYLTNLGAVVEKRFTDRFEQGNTITDKP